MDKILTVLCKVISWQVFLTTSWIRFWCSCAAAFSKICVAIGIAFLQQYIQCHQTFTGLTCFLSQTLAVSLNFSGILNTVVCLKIIRMHLVPYFMNCSKRLTCKILLENEHTFMWKTHFVDYIITEKTGSQQNWSKAVSLCWTAKQMMLREVNYNGGGGGGHLLHACFIIYTCLLLCCILYGTFCMSSSNC